MVLVRRVCQEWLFSRKRLGRSTLNVKPFQYLRFETFVYVVNTDLGWSTDCDVKSPEVCCCWTQAEEQLDLLNVFVISIYQSKHDKEKNSQTQFHFQIRCQFAKPLPFVLLLIFALFCIVQQAECPLAPCCLSQVTLGTTTDIDVWSALSMPHTLRAVITLGPFFFICGFSHFKNWLK